MSSKFIYSFIVLITALVATWMLLDSDDDNEEFSEVVKISLRDAGNQLLLSNNDTTSLILPVVALKKSKYKLSFQNSLTFEPNTLVSVIKSSFHKLELPKYYRVAVIQCADQEVAYSYEIKNETENDIIPCAGRFLPERCYTIEVRFTNNTFSFLNKKIVLYLLIILAFLAFQLVSYKRKPRLKAEGINGTNTTIGSFQFYPEQSKLVKASTEINLSKKECELLAIFAANPNQIIKRVELTKKVWEDNGVFVGRSLDTYISKLRKKLKADDTIKLTNVHGIGYKLEVN
ncbi:winged helix-turn-helix domain-containing protein [Aureibaculum luteum]|uniref:winged helix-turn-helix domain-containing protein n=1 Tax=Aureibaculum luteum TaxID=1548456 RepID=UPI001E5C6B03|nr:winged helix-turn-helix domain-containing protein [Aureibaculum luteum]